MVEDFKTYIETHRDEITALQIFYSQPFRRRELTYKMVKELLERLKTDKPALAPLLIWQAYEKLDQVQESSPLNELTALVALIRRVMGIDSVLTPYDKTVDKNFKDWIFKKHSGAGEKYTEEQMAWLRMMKEHIASSFHLDVKTLTLPPLMVREGGVNCGSCSEIRSKQLLEN